MVDNYRKPISSFQSQYLNGKQKKKKSHVLASLIANFKFQCGAAFTFVCLF